LKLESCIFLVLILFISPFPILSLNLNITPEKTIVVTSDFPHRVEIGNRIGASCTSYNGMRTYVKYDLPDINMDIERATLWFYKEEENNIWILNLGFYHVGNDNWDSSVTWGTQPCETVWDFNSNCDLKPFFSHKTNGTLNIWESFDVTDIIRNEEDEVFSFVLKIIGSDTICEIDQWIYYGNNSFLEIEGCFPDWRINNPVCQQNDTKFVYYTDANNCETSYGLPEDNGTHVECDYCIPNWIEFNTTCQPDDTILGYFIDENNCYSQTYLESDLENKPQNNTYFCDYCVSEWILNDTWGECQPGGFQYRNYYDINECLGTELPPEPNSKECNYTYSENVEIMSGEVYVFDVKDEANVSLEIMVDENITDGVINITSYLENPVNSTFSLLDIGNYIDISVSPEISEGLTWVLIKIYYMDEEVIKANVEEEELRIYTFNEDTSKWEKVDDSGVDTSLNYVWGNVSHFSFYGIFEYKEYCGDGICNSNETYSSCPGDCPRQTTTTIPTGGGGSSVYIKRTTTTTTTSIITTTTLISTTTTTTTTTGETTTTTIGENIGPTGKIVKTTGKFFLPGNNIMLLLITTIILLILFLLGFSLLKKNMLFEKPKSN